MNYYVILGIPRTASAVAIRTAFRGLVRRYHPDTGAGSSANRFRDVVEAYETLSDPERRRKYDATLGPAIRPSSIPLTPQPVEPLMSPRVVTRSSPLVDVWTYRERAFEELLRSLERLFVDF